MDFFGPQHNWPCYVQEYELREHQPPVECMVKSRLTGAWYFWDPVQKKAQWHPFSRPWCAPAREMALSLFAVCRFPVTPWSFYPVSKPFARIILLGSTETASTVSTGEFAMCELSKGNCMRHFAAGILTCLSLDTCWVAITACATFECQTVLLPVLDAIRRYALNFFRCWCEKMQLKVIQAGFL